ncbi:hypothetical protein RR48_01508 [Papilio machaon]|uniref:Uncharacterized protein n=1 Tax=Papilio machaon TaxID=76193 RepID=A0A0N1PI94_PAPMA|nr:hypothetical protein RR48_01508 [Papilio machaon]
MRCLPSIDEGGDAQKENIAFLCISSSIKSTSQRAGKGKRTKISVLTSVVAAYRDSHEGLHGEGNLESIKLNPRIIENREQLKRIIKYLNGHYDEYEGTENSLLGNFVPKDRDVENNIVNEQEARILAALSLLQKNYNNLLRHGNEKKRPRLLYIDNPEVLEEYKNNLRDFSPWSFSDSADYDSDDDRILTDELFGHRKFDINGVLTSVVAAYRDSHEGLHGEGNLESIKLNPRIIENREQLKRIIKYLNGHYDEYEGTENSLLGNFVPKDRDVENNIVNEQEARILAALSLLQKNYNNLLRHGNEQKRPRLLYIDNPEVLEEYKNNLRGFSPWSSSDSTDYDSDDDRILTEELFGHRKFDINGPSKDKNAEKRNHNRSRHKNHGSKASNDPGLRNSKNIHPKGRFKIAKDKRIPQITEGKRPKIKKKHDKKQKFSDDNLDVSNLKFDKREKIAANIELKEFKKDQSRPSRPKYTDKKYPIDDMWDKSMDDNKFIRKRPITEELSPNKRVITDLTSSKRYDVEMEAIKLFGEPLSSVILRLRRTPEYLAILNDQLENIKMEREEFADHLLETYRKDLIAKIEKMYHVNESGTLHPEILRKANSLRNGRRPSGPKSKSRFLRQGDDEEDFDKYLVQAVEALDNHPILNSVLSVAERNDFKDMGFELAGQYIHSLIDSLKPSDLPLPSTQQPWGDNDNFSITSEHDHVVTPPPPVTVYVNELNSSNIDPKLTLPPKYYKQRMKVFHQ